MKCIKLLKTLLSLVASDLKSPKLKKCDILFFCHDNDRSFIWKRKYYSPLIDSIRDEVIKHGLLTQTVAVPFSFKTGTTGTGNPVSVNIRYSFSKIADKINKNVLNLAFGREKRFTIRFWEKIIFKTLPNLVLGIQPSEELCAAAKKLNILICDLQHGIIEPSFYYSKRKNSFLKEEGIPDVVLCWDNNSENNVSSEWPQALTLNIGNPWHGHFKENLTTPISKQAILKTKLQIKKKSPLVLITTQWNKKNIKSINIPQKVIKIIKTLAAQKFFIGVKFHPVQLSSKSSMQFLHDLTKAIPSNHHSQILNLSEYALPSLFLYSKIHLTRSSASAIEASQFGVKTVLWANNKKVKQWFLPYLKKRKMFFLHSDPKKAILQITTLLKSR